MKRRSAKGLGRALPGRHECPRWETRKRASMRGRMFTMETRSPFSSSTDGGARTGDDADAWATIVPR